MLRLVDEVFATRSDPSQLQVDEHVLEKLARIHPATLAEKETDDGPIAWILLIPTTRQVMNDFIAGKISEQELLDRTQPGETYEAIYLCSATILPEYRGKGLGKQLTMEAIGAMRKEHPIEALYVWPFTKEGDALAEQLAKSCGLPLFKKSGH